MKKRTILSLLLAALMLLSFAACTGSAAATAPKADAEPAVKIKFTAIYDDTTKEFNLETTEKTLGAALLKEGIIAWRTTRSRSGGASPRAARCG